MSCDEIRPLIDAYVDGELDAARIREIDRHAADCDLCRDSIAELQAARRLVSAAPYYRAPAGLLARITEAIEQEEPTVAAGAAARRGRGRDDWARAGLWDPAAVRRSLGIAWGAFGAAAAAALILAAILVHRPIQGGAVATTDTVVAEVVSAHIRSLQPGHLADVISTDKHTVKPWFAGRIDYSPTVADFADHGFPLIGGRLDYVDSRPVAALVYRRYRHLVNVFVWPAAGSTPVQRSEENGYNVYAWTGAGERHYVVSDAAPAEIDQLVGLLSH